MFVTFIDKPYSQNPEKKMKFLYTHLQDHGTFALKYSSHCLSNTFWFHWICVTHYLWTHDLLSYTFLIFIYLFISLFFLSFSFSCHFSCSVIFIAIFYLFSPCSNLKKLRTISTYWFYLLHNHVDTSTKSK